MTKKKRKAAQKFVDAVTVELNKEFNSARMEAVIYGVALLALDAEGGLRHIPMESLAKGELFGGLQKNTL